MKNTIDIQSQHKKIVLHILQKHLPENATVWVFGSRAHKKAKKKYSDLDLAIDINGLLSLQMLADLIHDFEESALPYKVDIIDWNNISDSFKHTIDQNRVLLYTSS